MSYSITGTKGDDYNLEIIDEQECKTYVQAERVAEKMSHNKEIDNIEIMVTGKHPDDTSYWHPREGASMTSVNWKDEFKNGYTPK